MTKTLKASFQVKHQLKDFSLKIPDFYSIDLELNKKTEAYIKELKSGKSKSATPEKKAGKGKFKPKFATNLEIEVEEEAQDTVPAINKQPLSSLQELSNVPLQITTPNFNKAVQKKELFKPPQPNKIATNILSPRIRVISPTGEIAEGNKLMELAAQKNGSGRLTDYNPFNPFLPREIIVNKQSSEEKIGSKDLDQADQANEAAQTKVEVEAETKVEEKVAEEKKEKNEEETEQGNNNEEEEETAADNNGEEEDDYKVPCFASN